MLGGGGGGVQAHYVFRRPDSDINDVMRGVGGVILMLGGGGGGGVQAHYVFRRPDSHNLRYQ